MYVRANVGTLCMVAVVLCLQESACLTLDTEHSPSVCKNFSGHRPKGRLCIHAVPLSTRVCILLEFFGRRAQH